MHIFPAVVRSLTLVSALAMVATGPAFAQILEKLGDAHRLTPWLLNTGNTIRFCSYASSETRDLDIAVGEAIADRILLDSSFTSLKSGYGIGGEFADEDLYISLTNDCDVVLGMGLGSDAYPAEFTITRPYVSYGYLTIAADAELNSLNDLAATRKVGTQMLSYGAYLFRQYNAVRPADQRWTQLVYADMDLMLTRLLEDTVGVGIIFGPSWRQLRQQRNDSAQVKVLDPVPELASMLNVGAVLLSNNVFMRTEIDKAITDLVDDGTMAAILVRTEFDAIGANAGGF
ncbi:transporter substrate-binding domain-containing protein [Devosia sp. 2618]|uniref:transporter substrate-binding domain-containing protein n=1 Tax=Devosia sp. 2618 TaxID=3156454 RepID=UPI003390DABF